jgi:diguanylate cyclase (GGDEF)-like protein
MEQTVLATVREILAGPKVPVGATALDELTGAYAASFGVQRLQEEAERATRYRHPLSCLVVGVDQLTGVIEQHGPARGERVLQDVATILRHTARPSDVVARLDDRFLLITPRLEETGARAFAERVMQKVARHRFPVPGGTALTLTASCGIAVLEATCPDAEALIQQGLAALDVAQDAGGSRAAVA